MSLSTYGGYALMAVGVVGMVYAGISLSQVGRTSDEDIASVANVTPDGGLRQVPEFQPDTALQTTLGLPAESDGFERASATSLPDVSTPQAPGGGFGSAPADGATAFDSPGPVGQAAPPAPASVPAATDGPQLALAPTAPDAPGLTPAAPPNDITAEALGEPPAPEVARLLGAEPSMTAAIQAARRTLPDILDLMVNPPAGTAGYSLNVAVETADGAFEQMWMDNCVAAASGAGYDCQAANDGVATGLSIGDPFRVMPGRIADWMYLEGTAIHGAYTLRLQLDQMDPAQAEAFRTRLAPLPG